MHVPNSNLVLASLTLVGLAGTLTGLFALLTRPGSGGRWAGVGRLVMPLTFSIVAAIGLGKGELRLMWLPPALLAALSLGLLLWRLPRVRSLGALPFSLLATPRVQGAVILVVSPLLAAWAALEFERELSPLALTNSMAYCEAIALVPAPDYALTDAGSAVVLHQAASEDLIGLKSYEELLLGEPGVRECAIRMGPADDTYNCHGWTFTGGRWWVKGEEVDRILTENGYRCVEEPQEDDLAIYRSETGGPVIHSGIVRAASAGGPVLIESKWGRAGRFVHPPKLPFYPGSSQYYRRNRPGHQLRNTSQPAVIPVT